MTQAAVGYQESTNGQQGLSSGLRVHKGLMDVGSLRVNRTIWPNNPIGVAAAGGGSGLELAHAPFSYSAIQSFDREHAAWLDLNIAAKNINLQPQGGKVALPSGTVQSAPAVIKYIATWNIPSTAVWTETPVQQVLAVTAGNIVRVEASGTLTCTQAGAVVYVGLGIDGGILHDSMFCAQPSNGSNTLAGYHVTGYFTSITTTGSHRFSVFLYTNGSPSVAGLWGGAYNYLWITEQKA